MKMPNNPAKYEVLVKQYLRSILDISELKEMIEMSSVQALAPRTFFKLKILLNRQNPVT